MARGWILGCFLVVLGAAAVSAQEPLTWGPLSIVTASSSDSVAVHNVLDLEGQVVAKAPLEPALQRALEILAEAGHPFAVARPRGFDLVDGRLTCRIEIDPGVQPRISAVTLEGAKVTRPGTVQRISGLQPEQIYTGQEDRQVRERLSRSGLFRSVGEVELLPGMEPEEILLRIPVSEPPYSRFRGVLGVSGRESKITGLVDLDLANIAGTARSAAGRWENRGNGLTRYAFHYREPWLPLVPLGLEGDLAHDVNEALYSYTKWEITADVTVASQWILRAGRGGSRAVRTGVASGKESEGFLMAGLVWEGRNSVINPTAGTRFRLESRRGTKTLTPSGDTLEVRLDRTRWNLEGEGYRRFGDRWLGVLKTSLQYLDTPEDSIPRWDLFAVGGAVSVRGYREEQFLSPAVWTVQGEWRWLQDSLGSSLYLFADGAFLSPAEGRRLRDTFKQFLLGTGIGVRQASRLGILGVEYGIAKGENPLDGRVHLRIDAVF